MAEDNGRVRELELQVARLEERHSADRESLVIARREIERRLSGMNELREQINSERGRFVERDRFEERVSLLVEALAQLDRRTTAIEEGEKGNRRTTAALVGIATVFIAIVSVVANVLT